MRDLRLGLACVAGTVHEHVAAANAKPLRRKQEPDAYKKSRTFRRARIRQRWLGRLGCAGWGSAPLQVLKEVIERSATPGAGHEFLCVEVIVQQHRRGEAPDRPRVNPFSPPPSGRHRCTIRTAHRRHGVPPRSSCSLRYEHVLAVSVCGADGRWSVTSTSGKFLIVV